MTGKKILLIEDNEKIICGNRRLFELNGYRVDAALTLEEARARISVVRPDAIVLDILLPDGSGLDLLEELRKGEYAGIPVLLLTGLTTREDVLRGLRAGGDDYLSKPYDFSLLLARVEALLRRAARVPETITMGRLTLELAANVARLDGADLLLAQKEFALLLIFAQHPDRFLNGGYLYEKVWNAPMTGDSGALKNAMARLRAKIAGSGWHIKWSRGEGYIFERE